MFPHTTIAGPGGLAFNRPSVGTMSIGAVTEYSTSIYLNTPLH